MTVSQPIQRPGWSSTHTYKTRWRPHASHSQHSSRLSKRLSSTTDPVRARASALQSVSTQTRQTQSSITQYLPTRNPVPNHYPAVTTNASSAIPTRPSLQQQTMASFFPSQNPNPRPHRATPVHSVHRQPTLVQTSLAGVPLRQDYGRAFGHPSNPRDSKLYRILSQNIHGLPQYATDVRSRHMVKRLSDRSIGDLHLWQELNLVPHLLPLFDSWKSRTRKTSLHSVFGINQRETHLHLLQPGGTMLTVGTRLVSRIRDSGSDHLGRWAWIRIGSEEISTVFISAYRPCLTKGATTVYQQQKRALNDNSCNPRELFFQDLSEEIQAFHQAGYNVVLGADLNEDVLSRRVRIFLEQTGLWNPILDIHGTNSPATHARNESFVAIDAILCSRGLKPSYCGYSAVGEACASDHVQLWIDFSKEELFGPGKDFTFTEAETLNSKNPVLVSKYNDQAIKQLSDALPKLQALREIPVSEFTDQDGYQYTQVYRRVRDVRKTIKSSLRHIYVGVHPWSPAWQKAQSTRILYTQVLKYRSRFNNGHSSTPA